MRAAPVPGARGRSGNQAGNRGDEEEVGTSEVAEDDEGWEVEEISELDVPGC